LSPFFCFIYQISKEERRGDQKSSAKRGPKASSRGAKLARRGPKTSSRGAKIS
jgi:hypothetical protein